MLCKDVICWFKLSLVIAYLALTRSWNYHLSLKRKVSFKFNYPKFQMLGENSKEAFDSQETQPGLVHIVVIALSFTLGLFSLVKYLYCHNDNEIKEITFFYVFGRLPTFL